mgnify:CR=1 FL=1
MRMADPIACGRAFTAYVAEFSHDQVNEPKLNLLTEKWETQGSDLPFPR